MREKNERRDRGYRLKDLNAVREVIERMVPGVSEPRIKLRPLLFAVSMEQEELARGGPHWRAGRARGHKQ